MKLLVSKEGVNISFVYSAMQLLDYTLGGHERHWISKYSKLEIPFPSIEEQTKIASFLSALDERLAHYTRQIALTESWKAGLMQRMFV